MNMAATFLILGALVKGIVDGLEKYTGNVLVYFYTKMGLSLIAVFILLFRTKMMIDDHHHFGEENQSSAQRFLRLQPPCS